jgi:hypothetical protein
LLELLSPNNVTGREQIDLAEDISEKTNSAEERYYLGSEIAFARA